MENLFSPHKGYMKINFENQGIGIDFLYTGQPVKFVMILKQSEFPG